MRPLVNRTTSVDVQIREARMLTIRGFVARFTRSETNKKSRVTTMRVTHQDPAERERLHWEAIQRGIDELVAQLPEDRGQQP